METLCCRICMKSDVELIWIYSTLSDNVIANIVMECTDVNISDDDGLPTSICLSCVNDIETAYRIRIQSQESDKKFREMLTEEEHFIMTKSDNEDEHFIITKDVHEIVFTEITDLCDSDKLIEEEDQVEIQDITDMDDVSQCFSISSNPEHDYSSKIVEVDVEDYLIETVSESSPKADEDEPKASKSFIVLDINVKMCCGCTEQFENEELLMEHSKEAHEAEKIMNDIKPFECNICYKRFTTYDSMFLHQNTKIRYKKYACSLCEKQYADKKGLKYHEKMHRNEKNYKCLICAKRFRCKSSINMHMKLHSKVIEKNFECPVCNKSFLRKSDLQSHQISHTSETPYACKLCSLKFKRKQHLTSHVKIHLGKHKLYGCRYCNESFCHPSSRRNHESKHTGIYPFNCAYCDKSFTRKPLYVKHMEKHSSNETAEGVEFLEEIYN